LDAPANIKPADNVIVRICKLGCEFFPSGKADTLFPNTHPRNKDYYDNFMKWAKITKNMAIWDYWILYTKQYNPPYLNALNLQKDIRFYRDNNVKTMFVECESPINTSFAHFKYWFGLKMMQNPDLDYDKLTERFCLAYYGPAAKPMKQYIDYLQMRENAADIPLGRTAISFKASTTGARKCGDVLPYTDLEFFTKVNAWLDEAETLAASSPECLAHIRKERLPVDCTLLNSWSKYAAAPPVGTLVAKYKESLFNRYAAAYNEQARYFYGGKPYNKNAKTLKEIEDHLEITKTTLISSDAMLPGHLKGKDALIFAWPMLSRGNSKNLTIDEDAFGGRALKLQERDSKDYHRLPFTMGTYNRNDKKFMLNYSIPEAKIPQDGKYHWYEIGRCEILPGAYTWIHWTWLMQCYIDGAYCEGEDNNWNVHVSLKLVGEPYVKGSKEKPQVLVDRIILVK